MSHYVHGVDDGRYIDCCVVIWLGVLGVIEAFYLEHSSTTTPSKSHFKSIVDYSTTREMRFRCKRNSTEIMLISYASYEQLIPDHNRENYMG